MTDRERILISLVSHPDGGITTLEIVAMLYELGAEHRLHERERRLVGATAG